MSRPLKLLLVAGARPNFMKVAPLIHAIERHNDATLSNRIGEGQEVRSGSTGGSPVPAGVPPGDSTSHLPDSKLETRNSKLVTASASQSAICNPQSAIPGDAPSDACSPLRLDRGEGKGEVSNLSSSGSTGDSPVPAGVPPGVISGTAASHLTGIDYRLVHTGQHYDAAMSDVFFKELGIPAPDFNLEVGSGSHAVQTAEIMKRFEPVLLNAFRDSPQGGNARAASAVALSLGADPKFETRNSELGSALPAPCSPLPPGGTGAPPVPPGDSPGDTASHSSLPAPRSALPAPCSPLPDWLIVFGDVNSTVACTLVAAKLGIRVAHVEAGLRSFDRTMPEEINRIVTDSIADLLLTPSEDANENLRREGVPDSKIALVGNIMIDSLVANLRKAQQSDALKKFSVQPGDFVYVTLHRPANVDDHENLGAIAEQLKKLSHRLPVVFPVHPRTRKMFAEFGIGLEQHNGLRLVDPVGYHDSVSLTENARLVLTDSGGLQEEATFFRTPCLTLRPNTERPVTVTVGSNRLTNVADLPQALSDVLSGPPRLGRIPPLWDGRASERILDALLGSTGDSPVPLGDSPSSGVA